MTFSVSSDLEVSISQQSLRQAENTIQSELSGVTVGVDGSSVSSQLAQDTGSLPSSGSAGGSVTDVLDEQTERLVDIHDTLEKGLVSGGGGGGGGIISSITGDGGSGLLGGLLTGTLALKAKSVLSVGGSLALKAKNVLSVAGSLALRAGSVLGMGGLLTLSAPQVLAVGSVLTLTAGGIIAVNNRYQADAAKVLGMTGVLTIGAAGVLAVTGVVSLPAASVIAISGAVSLAAGELIDVISGPEQGRNTPTGPNNGIPSSSSTRLPPSQQDVTVPDGVDIPEQGPQPNLAQDVIDDAQSQNSNRAQQRSGQNISVDVTNENNITVEDRRDLQRQLEQEGLPRSVIDDILRQAFPQGAGR